MIILLTIITFVAMTIFIILSEKTYEDVYDAFSFISGILFVLCLITTIGLSIKCSKLVKLDELITMYQEENENIENKMDVLVRGYMDYEKTTLTEFSPESSITLVSLYPELKSDELVKQQTDLYMNNINKIKELKEQQVYSSVYKWWLYFG